MKTEETANRIVAGIAGIVLAGAALWISASLTPIALTGLSAYAWPRTQAQLVKNKLLAEIVPETRERPMQIPRFKHTLEFEARFNAPGPEAEALGTSRFNAAPPAMNLGFLAQTRSAALAAAAPLQVRCRPGGPAFCLVEPGIPFEAAWLALTLPLILCLAGACAFKALGIPFGALSPPRRRAVRVFAFWSGLLLAGFLAFPLLPALVGRSLSVSFTGAPIALYALAGLPLSLRWAR